MDKIEKHKILNAIIYPIIFVALMGITYLIQFTFNLNLYKFGIYPRKLSGLVGVICAPFIHANFSHLFNNVVSFFILTSTLFFFYKKIALKVIFWVLIMGGFWTWVAARESYHIGASGVIYGIFSFLLISGFLRKNIQLIAISLFVVFVYGGMIWGIFPIKVQISYEGHMWGFVAGIILAIFYRKQGPQKIKYEWPDEDDENDEDDYWNIENKPQSSEINYFYKPKNES